MVNGSNTNTGISLQFSFGTRQPKTPLIIGITYLRIFGNAFYVAAPFKPTAFQPGLTLPSLITSNGT